MQGMAAPLPIHRMYHIHWQVWIGLLFHYIFPVFPPVLYFMSALEGGDVDQNHVSCPQGHYPATLVIVLFVVPCLLLLE